LCYSPITGIKNAHDAKEGEAASGATMFDIAFVGDVAEPDGWTGLAGRIRLDDWEESFLAPLDRWQRSDYERQWIEAAQRILSPAARTGFFTSAFHLWWVMWREGEEVIVQEHLFTPERLVAVADWRAAPYQLIEDRDSVSEDGTPVSEWFLNVADIKSFLARRSA
jgi:hypothetical protein